MFLKKRRASTDPRLRSLLQKAVRRGHVEVAEAAARRVYEKGDRAWLRSRAVVVTFEEAWPLAGGLALDKELDSRLTALRLAARSVKYKDAASLGALAWACHEGDVSMLDLVPSDWPVRVLVQALMRPSAFFDWVGREADAEHSRAIVEAARRYLPVATWGWDKACILAGAFLAATTPIPERRIAPLPEGGFPFWVALDKHTPEGKDAIRAACSQLGATYRQAIWCSFYFESATVNELAPSPWWVAEQEWRLRRVGLTLAAAQDLWQRLMPDIAERLSVEARILEEELVPPLGQLFNDTRRSVR